MAMRRNQPNIQAKDLPDSGVMSSASFRPGEKRAMTGGITCGSMGTAIASARKPATRLIPTSRRKRRNLYWGIAADSSRGFRGACSPSYGKIRRKFLKNKGHYEFPAKHPPFLNQSCRRTCCAHHLAACGDDPASPGSAKAADANDQRVSAEVHAGHQGT